MSPRPKSPPNTSTLSADDFKMELRVLKCTLKPLECKVPGEELKLRKLFVGGLPWTTTTETLKKHFEQYGEIEEAAVIFDKETSKSKGFGFVTMKERRFAEEACKDPNPYIDGRKANVNLAFLGQKPRTNSLSGSNTNLSALGLRSGAITPTSGGGGPGLLGHAGHIGMHGANLGYMYQPQYAAAAALMLQQNLALAQLQQQQQLAQLAAAAAAQNPTSQSGNPSPPVMMDLHAYQQAALHASLAGGGGGYDSAGGYGGVMQPGTQLGPNAAAAAQLALLQHLSGSQQLTGSQSP